MGLVFTIHTQKSGQRETSLGSDPADAILATALGVTDEHSIFFPALVYGRVIGLIYADKIAVDALPQDELAILVARFGAALATTILRSQIERLCFHPYRYVKSLFTHRVCAGEFSRFEVPRFQTPLL